MDVNRLVCENQVIKIVPSIEDSLKILGLDVDIDDATEFWFQQLTVKWKTWKQGAIIENHFQSFFELTPDPFRVVLLCIIKCPEFKECKIKSLPYYILERLYEWSQKHGIFSPETVKLPAFHVAIKQRSPHFLTLAIKTYNVCTIKDNIIPIIREMTKNDNCKQALQIVTAIELFDEIPIEDLLFPFILQDRANMIDEYLSQFPDQVPLFLTFLDKLLDKKFNLITFSHNFIDRNNIRNVKYSKLHPKPLGKLVARLCNKFNIPIESCKNLSKNRTTSGLKYLIHQKYMENNVSLTVWDDLVKDSLNNSIECAYEFIDILITYDIKEAAKWATHFKIPRNKLPFSLRNLSIQEEGRKEEVQEEEDWDDSNNVSQFYKLPLPEDKIILIDKGEDFNNLISNLAKHHIIGLDCEWKPSFGASQSHVALMQIATYQDVYLIDTMTLNAKQYTNIWHKFNKTIIENAEIIKIGFGLEQDLREMKTSIIGLSNIRIKGEGLLDLSLLWRSLINCGLSLAASSDVEGMGLSCLVQSCFGLPLEKSEQCSNWELRPLRGTQIKYAALDAYVLVALYKHLHNISIEQKLNFDEVCNDVMLDKKPKSTKKASDKLLSCKLISQPQRVGQVKLLIESDLLSLMPYLRYLGFDTIYIPGPMLWHDAIKLAQNEERLVLTFKMKFSPTLKYPQTCIFEVGKVVEDINSITEKIASILKNFNITVQQSDLLSRCIQCNGLELRQIETNEINDLRNSITNSKADVYDNRYNSDNDDFDPCDNFLSDSDDDSCLYRVSVAPTPKTKCLTSKGVEIAMGDIIKLSETQKSATLCENCGKLYWDEDLSFKSISDIYALLPTLGN